MRILIKPAEKFLAKCPTCFAYLEYDNNDIEWIGADLYVKCPCCDGYFGHIMFGKPVRESEDTE